MSMGENLSPADIAALTNNNGSNSGFGGDGSAWWVLIFLLLFAGGNRYGYGGGQGSGAFDNYVLSSDFATLQRQIDSVGSSLERKSDSTQQGLCDGFYAQNTNTLNGFAGVQQSLCQGFSGVNNSIVQSGYETRNAINSLGYSLQDCCCKTQQSISDLGYNISNKFCGVERAIDGMNYNNLLNTTNINNSITAGFNGIQNAMCANTRDIIESNNANYRALHDEIVANRIEDKNAQILAQQNEINALRLRASQEAQNTYLISQLKPCPSPSYIVPNPNCCYNFPAPSQNCGCPSSCC